MELRVALWLCPPPSSPLFQVLKSTINGLAPIFDDAPEFDPHITLCTGIQIHNQEDVDFVLETALAAAHSVPHLNATFNKISYGRTFFRKVVFEVDRTPELVSLATICHERFVKYPEIYASKSKEKQRGRHKLSSAEKEEIDRDAQIEAKTLASAWSTLEFKPHLSLVYSNLDPVSESTRLIVNERLCDVFGSNYETRGLGWTNGELKLVLCSGPCEQWQVLKAMKI